MSINYARPTKLEAALRYNDLGFNVIPVGKDKKPLVKWEPYQKTRTTADQIQEWFSKRSDRNMALVTGAISNLFVIDTDTPGATAEIQNYIPENLLIPIQRTPHDGRHFFFKHEEGFANRARLAPGIDIRTTGGYIVVDPSMNGDGNRWEWLEDLSLFNITPIPLPDTLLSYLKEFAFGFSKRMTTNLTTNTQNVSSDVVKMFAMGTRDDDLFHIANQLVKARTEPWKVQQVIEILAEKGCEPPFPQKEIQDKVKSALQRAERRERNLTEEVREWVLSSSGRFLSSSVVRSLHLSSREEEKNLSKILSRLNDEGIIEKYGDKRGEYRVVEVEPKEIDFLGVEEKIVDLKFPFMIEKWVKLLPKNIVIVAGEPNAGKTAFLLNVCYMNMGKFKIHYFSSEMGPMELRARLNKFEGNIVHWKENISFKERSSNFADVIKPNDINIIDFLEITDEFYKIGGMIQEIWNKLKKGLALIALQKNPKTDVGLGGMRSVEKARLYLAMGREKGQNKLKIVKGKNWATDFNPNGMEFRFKLIQGAKFIETGVENRYGGGSDE